MNSINESILESASIILNSGLSKAKFDKTIKAEIYKIIDLDSGEYKVQYEANIFSAFSSDLTKTYKVGDSVYITVPEGDFSNKKIITSVASAQSLSYNQMTQLQNSIFTVSPTFDELYKNTKGQLYDPSVVKGVIAGTPDKTTTDNGEVISTASECLDRISEISTDKSLTDQQKKQRIERLQQHFKNSINYIYEDSDSKYTETYHGLFQQYARNYEYIRVRASFKTQFHSTHNDGNYGIRITFYTKNDGEISYNLDLPSFVGSFYTFNNYAPQQIILKTKKDYLLGLKSITLFEENFQYDRKKENGVETTIEIKDKENIFCKDVKLDFVEIKDLSDSEYYLTIQAPQGLSFIKGINGNPSLISLDLVGKLVYRGQNIIDKNCVCSWFERDAAVMIGHKDYNKDVGIGWAPLKIGASDGQTKNNILTLTTKDVPCRQKYKLLVVYNDKVKLTAEVEVTNEFSDYAFSLVQVSGTQSELDKIWLELRKEKGPKGIYGNWYALYPDGSYEEVQGDKGTSKIAIESYMIYSPVTFYCVVFSNDGIYLGTLEHTTTLAESGEDITIKYIGQDTIYRYDANGDVTFEDSEKERFLTVEITWKNNIGASYYVEWFVRDKNNQEVAIPKYRTQAITPDNSMLKEIWVDNYNILHYTIKQKYSVNYSNNVLILKIRTAMDDEYLFNKEILFIKDGDQGTNGTTYIAAIRPCDEKEDKLSGVQPLVYNNGWRNTLNLKCYVYKDGELINGVGNQSNQSISVTYRWEGINIGFTKKPTDRDKVVNIQGIGNSINQQGQYYIKVQVSIVDKTDDKRTSIYALYPIDVAVGGIDYTKIDIDDVIKYIKYTPSGLNPTFYRDNMHFYYNGTDYSTQNKVPGVSILTSKLLSFDKVAEDITGFKLQPIETYIFEDSAIAALKFSYTSSQYLIHPIIMYLDTYGNEAINGWDGTKLYIEEDKERFLFAPQIGAGEKDSANRFTGVVMGKYDVDNETGMPIGLYGFKNGLNTFGLMDNGKAFFGAKNGGGQIVIDGRYAVIYGGDIELRDNNGTIVPAANGMYIRLADSVLKQGEDIKADTEGAESNKVVKYDGSTKAIGIGWAKDKEATGSPSAEERFYVTYSGMLKATNANIQGNLYATAGCIGGNGRTTKGAWIIETGRLHSENGRDNSYIELNSEEYDKEKRGNYAIWCGNSEAVDAPFSVTKTGILTSKQGQIGGWTITGKELYNKTTSESVGMASSGSNVFWAGKDFNNNTPFPKETDLDKDDSTSLKGFLVSRSGKLYCTDALIKGTVNATKGKIGGWTISKDSLKNGEDIYLSPTGGIKMGGKFSVTSSGEVNCSDINVVNNGSIKGGEISGSKFSGGSIDINGVFKVDPDGSVTCTKLTQLQSGSGDIDTVYINIYDSNELNDQMGKMGYVEGNKEGNIGVGIQSNGIIILDAKDNIKLSTDKKIIFEPDSIDCLNTTIFLTGTEFANFSISGVNTPNWYFAQAIVDSMKSHIMSWFNNGGTTI